MRWEAVIGIEVHVQLKTVSKMFTRVAYRYGAPPNTLTNPVVLGLPGTLPVLNRAAVERAIQVGLILGCEIPPECKWDRKNYFYPDMSKNYQISQYDQPLCVGGSVEIELPGPSRNVMGEHRRIQLTRIHLEEDVAKSTHFGDYSLIDFNRAGCPLIEIVSEPEIHSAEEAAAYLNALRMNLSFAGISDCDMEKGQLRCDANISIRPEGSNELFKRTEVKNLNSVSGVRAALEFERRRQREVVEAGGTVAQETRHWNELQGYSVALRSKEEAHDYRYFPDPDLMPVRIGNDLLEQLRKNLPEMPFDKQRRYIDEYGLPFTVTSVICRNRGLSLFFEEALAHCERPRELANFVVNDLRREMAAAGIDSPSESRISARQLAALVRLIDEGTISKQSGQDVFTEIFESGGDVAEIIDEKGLRQSTDSAEIELICKTVIDDHAKPAAQFRSGKEGAINFLKGQVMRLTRGKADPAKVDQILRSLLRQ